ncbi:MAG TPA: hypothetical protein VNT58_04345, partial [Gaiellaceae bacterium]|nr:hypothetical protein [Gaiellaceae bacterium]
FITAYRAALARGAVTNVSEEERAFDISVNGVEGRVRVDAAGFPERFVPARGHPIDFAAFEGAPAVPEVAGAPEGPEEGRVVSSAPVKPAEAGRHIGFKPRIPAAVAGLALRSLRAERLVFATASGALTGRGVTATYGGRERRVTVQESRSPTPAYAFRSGLTVGGSPIPRAPKLALHVGSDGAIGQFRAGQLFITIRAADAAVVVEAASALVRP